MWIIGGQISGVCGVTAGQLGRQGCPGWAHCRWLALPQSLFPVPISTHLVWVIHQAGRIRTAGVRIPYISNAGSLPSRHYHHPSPAASQSTSGLCLEDSTERRLVVTRPGTAGTTIVKPQSCRQGAPGRSNEGFHSHTTQDYIMIAPVLNTTMTCNIVSVCDQ